MLKIVSYEKEADAIVEDFRDAWGLYYFNKRYSNFLCGIDESNGQGVYILYPKHIQQTAADIWVHCQKHKIKQL